MPGEWGWLERRIANPPQPAAPRPAPAPPPREFDRVRQQEIAFTLGQMARRRYEQRVRGINEWLQQQRTEACKAADDELAAALAEIRRRATIGDLADNDLKG